MMCKCVPMGFLLLNVVLTGDVILIKTHAPVPTHTHTPLTTVLK